MLVFSSRALFFLLQFILLVVLMSLVYLLTFSPSGWYTWSRVVMGGIRIGFNLIPKFEPDKIILYKFTGLNLFFLVAYGSDSVFYSFIDMYMWQLKWLLNLYKPYYMEIGQIHALIFHQILHALIFGVQICQFE